jgi:hypothetical protein
VRVRSGTVVNVWQCAVRPTQTGAASGKDVVSGPGSSFVSHRISLPVMGAAHKLPPSFTSSYRLFLRASSASVLHHRAATHYVRTLWKPTFREAAVVIRKLQSPTLRISEKEQLEEWRRLWELSSEFRVDISVLVVKVDIC